MATRLYFHAASNALSGTFPAGEQSSLVASYSATGSNTLRKMDTTKGVLQSSTVAASLATLSEQTGFYGFFCSQPFSANQNVGGAGQTVTLNIANSMNGTQMVLGGDLRFSVYVWRPSTGAKVGTVGDALALTGDAVVSNTTERVNNGTTTATTQVAVLAGDVLVCEVWQIHTQTLAVTRTGTFFFDGTVVTAATNTFVGDHAAFLEFSADNLTFGASGVNASLAVTLASDSASSASAAGIAAQSAVTMQSDTASAQGQARVSASASLTNQGDSASSQASSQSSVSASLSVQLANDQASSLSSVAISAQSTVTVQADSLSSLLSSAVSASLASQAADDSSTSSSAVSISANASIDESSDSAASESSLEIYANLFAANADDIMSASASAGEVEFSLERTLFIGAQVRINQVNAQLRQFYPVAQNRVVSMIAQNRVLTPEAQNKTLAPEPQNRNIAE